MKEETTLWEHQYFGITTTRSSTKTYTKTVFWTTTSVHSVINYESFTVTKTVSTTIITVSGLDMHKNGMNVQITTKPKVIMSMTATMHLTVTKSILEQKNHHIVLGVHRLDHAIPGWLIGTVTHTIISTVQAVDPHLTATNSVVVPETTVITERPHVSTVVTTSTVIATNMVITKTATSFVQLSTQSDGKRDVIILKRVDYVTQIPMDTLSSQVRLPTNVEANITRMALRGSLGLGNRDSITVTQTLIASTTVFKTRAITVPRIWTSSTNSTITVTITRTIMQPAAAAAGVGTAVKEGLEAGVEEGMKGGTHALGEPLTDIVVVATETIIATFTETLPISALLTLISPTTAKQPTTMDITHVVTKSNKPAKTVTKLVTNFVTLTHVPEDIVVTKVNIVTETTTVSGIYTMWLVSVAT
ncbi:hypothetical protein BGW36DRAFT_427883 [Talaromyces proteolyticus]|uniref:Uncharacterized protein n=1 Tax=Talaromyces proteolyticus TaxID=1131652 RepID=A0AAD4PYP9_9EURO|nr:uncharacterized protein BGW36DRAFT_427883 [Talaromyces proteolyticus]KAH8697949.1 hypothetical protein BGW36DRAFT_427883 [Talaromyces proteolyticus]